MVRPSIEGPHVCLFILVVITIHTSIAVFLYDAYIYTYVLYTERNVVHTCIYIYIVWNGIKWSHLEWSGMQCSAVQGMQFKVL